MSGDTKLAEARRIAVNLLNVALLLQAGERLDEHQAAFIAETIRPATEAHGRWADEAG